MSTLTHKRTQKRTQLVNWLSRKSFVLAIVGVLLLFSGTAYAAWVIRGMGAGYGKATTAQPLTTVDVSSEASPDLYPGADGTLLIRLRNPNPFTVRVTDLVPGGPITADRDHPACVITGLNFTPQRGLALDVPPGQDYSFILPGALHMDDTSDDGCQGATFTIPVEALGIIVVDGG